MKNSKDENPKNRIFQRRKELKLSLDDLEQLTGISAQQINRLEKGERRLNETNMEKLASALKLPRAQDIMISAASRVHISGTIGDNGIITLENMPPSTTCTSESGGGKFTPLKLQDNSMLPETVELPPELDANDVVAVRIEGNSMFPVLQDGWIVFYTHRVDCEPPLIRGGMQVNYNKRDVDPLSEYYGKLCVVKLGDGRVMIRTIKKGRERGRFTLASYNAPDIDDAILEWVAKIVYIKVN